MSTNLHYSIIKFFEERMAEHSAVVSYTRTDDSAEVIYTIWRTQALPSLFVHLSDAYFYGMHEFYDRPSVLSSSGFILIARPEANFGSEVLVEAQKQKVGIGRIGKLMSALHKPNCWQYKTAENIARLAEYEKEQKKIK